MTSFEQIQINTITGEPTTLAAYPAKAKLVVNVASQCGLTPQYHALEALYQQYKDDSFLVLGFPANNFKQQEPGSDAEIAQFCSTQYAVTFPLFAKLSAAGDDAHPLYQALTDAWPESLGGEPFRARLAERGLIPAKASDVLWNFEKFLLNEHNEVVARFAPNVTPDDPQVVAAIEKLLS